MKIGSSVFLLGLFILMITATFKFPNSYIEANADQIFLDPTWSYWLGTDSLGRDFFWRLILALRTSVLIAFGSTFISFLIGASLGSYSAWKEGTAGYAMNRGFDVIQGLPSFLLLALIMQYFTSSSTGALILFCGLFHWPQLARLTRSQIYKSKQEPFVEAAVSIGGSPLHILRVHLWPANYALWLAWLCYHIPMEILFESTLSFLGFGIQPPQTSLGLLMQEGWKYLDDQPLFLFAPAILSFLIVISFQGLWKAKGETVL